MKSLGAIAAGAALLVALAGCSSTTAPQVRKPAEKPKPSPTRTEDIRPWASVVSQTEATYRKWRDPWKKDECTALDADLKNSSSFACGLNVLTGAITANTLALQLDAAVSRSSKVYIGQPPASIASLYRDTKAAVDAASVAGDTYRTKCAGKSGSTCVGLAEDLVTSLNAVDSEFAAWTPYM